jgi:hypothetical protein
MGIITSQSVDIAETCRRDAYERTIEKQFIESNRLLIKKEEHIRALEKEIVELKKQLKFKNAPESDQLCSVDISHL